MRTRVAFFAALGAAVLAAAAACSKHEAAPTSAQTAEPAPSATAPAEPPPPVPTPTANATPTAAPEKALEPPRNAPVPAPKPATHAGKAPIESTPRPDLGKKTVAVRANSHYSCAAGEKRDDVVAAPEPHGARITIVGQGPCPGEVHDWSAELDESTIEIQAAHGAASKCRCTGSGELVLRGLDPGSYEVHVNGGYDRPIATRVLVSQ